MAQQGGTQRAGRSVLFSALIAMVVVAVAACNPQPLDPVSLGEQDEVAATYTDGPDAAWLEVAATGAPNHDVYVLGAVPTATRVGPVDRSCWGPSGAGSCIPLTGAVISTQRSAASTPPGHYAYTRLITLWPGEVGKVIVVCVDRSTQELGCPASLRTWFRTVDASGVLVGDLTPATP